MKTLGRAIIRVSQIMDGLTPGDRRLLVKAMVRHLATTVVAKFNHSGGDPPRHSGDENSTAVVAETLTTVVSNGRDPTPSSFLSSSPVVQKDYPEELQEIRVFLRKIAAPPELDDPTFWVRIDAWLGSANSGVGYLDELPAYLAWNAVQTGSRRHRDLQRGFRNWLAKSEYWSQQRAQRQAIRKGR